MKIKPFVFSLIVLVVFFGIIIGFQQAGVWSSSGKVNASGQRIEPSAGDVQTIKGWMTLEQVSTTYDVPVAEILSAFNLPADTPASTAVKDLESDTFSVSGLRTWLEERSQANP